MAIAKKTYRSGPYQGVFAQGILVGDVLYISGQVGTDQEGNTPTSIAEQARVAYANARDVLAYFGAEMSNIVDETYFVTDMEELMENAEAVFGAREAAYGEPPDVCQTLVQVAALVTPELKIEIKCIAHL